MKKALLYLILLFLLYGGWYYWRELPRAPLQTTVLPIDPESITSFSIQLPKGAKIRFTAGENEWFVEYPDHNIAISSGRPDSLLRAITSWESNGLYPGTAGPPKGWFATIELVGEDFREQLRLIAAADTLPNRIYVKRNELPDLLAIDGIDWRALPLRFNQYADFSLFDLRSLPTIDSLYWVTDSTRIELLGQPIDSLIRDSLLHQWQRLKANYFARDFDEIGDRDHRLGSFRLFSPIDSIDLTVYYDSLWPQPFVLHSSQFPRAYFSADELPYPLPN